LHRAGYDAWNWSDQALQRAMEFYLDLSKQYPDGGSWRQDEDDGWTIWVVNRAYGTTFPTGTPKPGKNMGWADWTHCC
jgi:hypothetical protein